MHKGVHGTPEFATRATSATAAALSELRKATEDEMLGWHHGLNAGEFEQTLGYSEGQGSLACCSP